MSSVQVKVMSFKHSMRISFYYIQGWSCNCLWFLGVWRVTFAEGATFITEAIKKWINVLILFHFCMPPLFKVNSIGVGSWHPWTLHFLINFLLFIWRLIKPFVCFDRLLAWTANKFCGKLVCSHSKVFMIFTIWFLQLSEINFVHIYAFWHIVSCIFVANCLSWELENSSNLKKWEKVCWWSLSVG